MDLVELSKAAFGEHPADVEKGVGDAARGAKQFGGEVVRGVKIMRGSVKGARAEAGYRSGVGGFKDSWQAGMKGNAKMYREGYHRASRVGVRRAKREMMTGRPTGAMDDMPAMMSARVKRSMSNIDMRLR